MGPRKLRVGVLLAFSICLYSFLSGCAEAGLRIIQPQAEVHALLGEDVTLPCVLADDKNSQLDLDLDLSIASVRWETKSLDGSMSPVYRLISGNASQFKNGSYIEKSEFKRGNASLIMQNVQISDGGEYSCTVFVTPDKMTARIFLHVSAKPSVRLTDNEVSVEPGHETAVFCEVTKFYPKSIEIHWIKFSQVSTNGSPLEREICFAENHDGTFNGSSLLLVKPSGREEDGYIYSCVVRHSSFTNDQTANITVKVKEKTGDHWRLVLAVSGSVGVAVVVAVALCINFVKAPPKLSEITGADHLVHLKRSTLTCMISGFKPMEIRVHVYVTRKEESARNLIGALEYSQNTAKYNADYERVHLQDPSVLPDDLLDGMETLKPKRSLLHSDCLCVLHVTPDIEKDDGAKLIIEVEHPALKSPISKHCTLKISGDFLMLSNINAPTYQIHGKEVTLKCCMTTFNKESLHISWLKKDPKKQELTKMIYDEGRADSRYSHEIEEKKDQHYQIWSSLKFKIHVKEDHAKQIVCMVNFPKANIIKKTELQIFVRAKPIVEAITPREAVPHVGQEMALTCRIRSFHPQDIEITWNTEALSLPAPDNEIHVGEDGLYNVTSVLRYIPQIEDIGRTFSCTVDHQSFDNLETRKWTLKDLRQNDV